MKSNLEAKTVFSTCLIGDRAKVGDELSFFTVPRGQHMPQIPFDVTRCRECNQPASRVLTDVETNIVQAGQLGSTFGEAKFEKIRAQFWLTSGDPVVLEAVVKLRVCGKLILETTLEKLVADWVHLEDDLESVSRDGARKTLKKVPFVLVARTDTVEARLCLTRETKIVGAPIAVRLEIAGQFITNVEPA